MKGWRFDLDSGIIATPNSYAKVLRDGFAYCKLKEVVVAPLTLEFKNKNNGKT